MAEAQDFSEGARKWVPGHWIVYHGPNRNHTVEEATPKEQIEQACAQADTDMLALMADRAVVGEGAEDG